MRTKRIKWLDFAKGIAILFVIIAHCAYIGESNLLINLLGYISFIFVMPLFLSISGFLYKKVNSIHDCFILLYKKCTSILIPYLIFSIGSFIINTIEGHKLSIFNLVLGYKTYNILWFLVSLLLVFIISGFANLLHINLVAPFFLTLCFIFSSPNFWRISNTLLHPHVYFIFSYFIFFYIGIFIRRYFRIFSKIFKSYLCNIICIIIFVILITIQIHETTLNYETNPISLVDILPKILSVFILYGLFINANNDNCIFKYFDKYGKYTLCIYLVHYPILSILAIFRSYSYPTISFIWIVIVTWIICILIYEISNKFKILNFIFYPRKYINRVISKTKFGKYLFRLNN